MNATRDLDDYLQNRDALSESQRAIADYLSDHPWEACTQTAVEIAAAVGVSASTVVRFARSIGFSGLPELQKFLSSHAKRLLRSREPIERVKFAREQLGLDGADDAHDIFLRVAQTEIHNIERTVELIRPDALDGALETMQRARGIYVLGLRGSLSLAEHFTIGMRYVRPGVTRLDNCGADLPDKLASLTPEDALIAFSFSPYTTTTVRAVKACRSASVPVVAITDDAASPVTTHANHALVTHNPLWFSSATAGATALVNALVFAVAVRLRPAVAAHIAKSRKLLMEMESFELNSMDNLLGILAGAGKA